MSLNVKSTSLRITPPLIQTGTSLDGTVSPTLKSSNVLGFSINSLYFSFCFSVSWFSSPIDASSNSLHELGIPAHLISLLLQNGFKGEFSIHAIDNKFVPAASVASTIAANGLDYESMLRS